MSEKTKRTVSIADLFRNRNFRYLWIGNTTSTTGFFVVTVIFDWYVYSATHQTLLLATLGVIEFVPMLTLGIIAGAFVDRHDRRRIMIVSDLVRAASLAALAVYVLIWGFNAVLLLTTVFMLSAFSTLFGPASDALLPSVVTKPELSAANGTLTAGSTVAQFVGSPLGGALIFLFGVGSGLIFNSVTYAFSAICVSLLSVPRLMQPARDGSMTESEKTPFFSDVVAGFQYLRSQRALLLLTLTTMVINFFSFYNLYIVVYSTTLLHAGPAIYGILLGASAVGAAVGGLIAHRLALDRTPGISVPIAWALSGLPLIALILLPFLPLALASMFTEGLASALVNVTFLSVVQRTVPDRMLGRYLSIDQTIGYSMIPAGIVAGGFIIVFFGLGVAFIVAGAVTFLLSLCLLISKEVRAWGREGAELASTRSSVGNSK